MHLKSLELSGFKSFARKSTLAFDASISAIVGPNGSGKSNIAEAFRFVLGEQSLKSMRGKRGEDLIWNGSPATPRANRASVRLYFDNRKRLFDLDFDEVAIERVVHRDGINQYAINGSRVRLRDVLELLAGANIGASGHHIISQGEADRILSASPRERREMIEDALGLKVFQFKLSESGRKLEKTKENIAQVESLRREIAPHLKFLKKQVEKVEKTRALRDELVSLYREYLAREHLYVAHTSSRLHDTRREPEEELTLLSSKREEAKRRLELSERKDEKSEEIIRLEESLSRIQKERDDITRELGRLEGQISLEESRHQREDAYGSGSGYMVSFDAVRDMGNTVLDLAKEARDEEDVARLRSLISRISEAIMRFIDRERSRFLKQDSEGEQRTLEGLREKKRGVEQELYIKNEEERKIKSSYGALRAFVESAKDESREAERALFSVAAREGELRTVLAHIRGEEELLARAQNELKRELAEGAALVGRDILSYEQFELEQESALSEERSLQEERRRVIERIKIRLEEFGSGSGDEILKEYEEVSDRDQFLLSEIDDLCRAEASLRTLMDELEEKLGSQFREGIVKINSAFAHFFELMFGGGTASLSVVKASTKRKRLEEVQAESDEEEEESEEGIDVLISLPHKRTKGLVMLSGGERALASIALLFAMSQVNPPPFLILDETDAALDEANSKRYGDMIESLSSYSQLILITHNRETMSRAGTLYGVTMGRDGVSKLLSVQFEEAVQVAK